MENNLFRNKFLCRGDTKYLRANQRFALQKYLK